MHACDYVIGATLRFLHTYKLSCIHVNVDKSGIHTCIHAYIHIHTYMHTYIPVFNVYRFSLGCEKRTQQTYIRVCMYTCICIRICLCVCVYIYICACILVRTYKHTPCELYRPQAAYFYQEVGGKKELSAKPVHVSPFYSKFAEQVAYRYVIYVYVYVCLYIYLYMMLIYIYIYFVCMCVQMYMTETDRQTDR